jgi:hypothetical protein
MIPMPDAMMKTVQPVENTSVVNGFTGCEIAAAAVISTST